MNVGEIIFGSPLLQKTENIQLSASAEDRSITNESINQENNEASNSEQAPYVSQLLPGKKHVEEMVHAMNKFIEPTHSALKFEYHEKLQEYYVTIINSDTKEIIKEVPPKKMLDMYASMAELLGFIVDEKK